MVLGTHNSMSYARPAKWWQWPGLLVARCQRSNYMKQYRRGVRCFDLRVRYDRKGYAYFAHGLMSFKRNVYETIVNLANMATVDDPIYIRFTLETDKPDEYQEAQFKYDAKILEHISNLVFFNGRRKFDWATVYDFEYKPTVLQFCGSMQSKYGKVFPWLWRLLNRRKARNIIASAKNRDDYDILLVDFI